MPDIPQLDMPRFDEGPLGKVEEDPSIAPMLAQGYQLGAGLVDLHYQNQLNLAKAQADANEVVSRAGYYNSLAQNYQSEVDQRQQLLPLDIQAKQQSNQLNGFKIQDTQAQMDQRQKALDEYPDWIGAVQKLNPTDPDYNSKLADINTAYPNASNDPTTMNQARPFFARHAQIQSQDTTLKRNTEDLNTLTQYQKPENGLIPRDVDIRSAVNSGRAQQWIDYGNRQMAVQRYQNAMPYMNPAERSWAQGEIGRLTGSYLVGDQAARSPDPTMLTPHGTLNPDSNAMLSTLERKYNLVPKPAGPTKDVVTKTYDAAGNVIGQTTIKGVPATATDITGGAPAAGQTGSGATQTPNPSQLGAAIFQSKAFQGVATDITSGKLKPPAGVNFGTPEGNAWLKEQYLSRAQQLNEPVPGAALPGRAPGPERAGGTSSIGVGRAESGLATVDPAELEPHLGGVLSGHAQDFVSAGQRYGIDPRFLASVAIEESGNGTSPAARDFNNPMGMEDPRTGGMTHLRFGSVAEAIDAAARNLRTNYLSRGLTDIGSIARKWAPPGAANDPQGTNAGWGRNVASIYGRLTG